MTDRALLERLTSALDQAEAHHRELLAEATRVREELQDPRRLGKDHPGWHLWPDVKRTAARMLRLVVRDRALAAAFMEAVADADGMEGGEEAATAAALRREVERAVDAWVVTVDA